MKSNAKSNLIILGILFALLPIITTNLSYITDNHNKSLELSDDFTLDKNNLKISAISEKIHIDNNWSAAKAVGICTGNGTKSEPYVIEDLVIDGGGLGSCILIENSDVYFIIENCNVYNSGSESEDAGIALYNLGTYLIYKGKLINNIITNCTSGIFLYTSINNIISGNDINNNGNGITIAPFSNGNEITGNSIMQNNNAGIGLGYSDRNNISGNIITNNENGGIGFYQSDDNDISRNTISNNGVGGIGFTDSYSNGIFLNCFDNSNNALDNAGNNFYRNYWADYIGSDADGDGFGDVPYNITGAAGSQDNSPLMKCPISAQDGGGIPIELIILVSVVSGGAAIGVATLLLIRRKRKRVE